MMLIKRWLGLFRMVLSANKVRLSQTEQEKILAQQTLARMMADARGVSMKIGQIFSDTDGSSAFQSLVESVQPVALKEMLPVLKQDLATPINRLFKRIDESSAAASLGQVHFAVLKTGEELAIKIRYPGIDKAVDAELRLAGLMPGMGPVKQWGFDIKAYKTSLRNNMLRELDYLSEAERQSNFAQLVKVDGLNVPSVYKALSTQRVLVQSRVSGVMIGQIADWPKRDKLRIGNILLTTLFKSLFVAGEVHGDPHAGNILYAYDQTGRPVVNLLDFGCTVAIAKSRRLALLKLIIACRKKTDASPLECFAELGFDTDKLSTIHGSLTVLSGYLFQPFLSDIPFNLATWHLEQDIAGLLGENRWWFRSAGPADLILLMRAFQGLIVQLKFLQVKLNWWQALQQAVGDELMQQAVDYPLPVIKVTDACKHLYFSDQAEKLCVQVTESGVEKVFVTLPANAVFTLEQIIPEDILQLISQSQPSVNLNQLVNDLRDHGLVAQALFELNNGNKIYKVWLQ